MSSLRGEVKMEDLEYDVEDREYKPHKWIYVTEWGIKIIFFSLGVFITVLLYNKCLFNSSCNTIVTIYFALLGLTCFLHAGFSIDKLTNVKLN